MLQAECNNVTQLWSDFLRGDNGSYATLYKLYARSMYHYGLHFTSDHLQVEDAIHDVFVKLFNMREKLPQRVDNVKLYLFVALKNTIFNLNAKNAANFRIDISECHVQAEDSMNVETRIIADEQQQYSRRLVARLESVLSVRQRQVLYYKYMEQLPYKDIAVLMDINVQSAKNMVQTALVKIRTVFPGQTPLLLIALIALDNII